MADPMTLFDATPIPAVRREKRTAGAVRRARQLECMLRGQHALAAALRRSIRLHPDAAPAEDRTAVGLRCGTCIHRVYPAREVAGRFPKCNFGARWERATAGPGTDVKAWFPACSDYEAVNTDG